MSSDFAVTQIGGASAPSTQSELKLGDVGDYELLEEVARGGMGIVYKARQKSLNRIVALKMILSGQFASREQLMRFRAEAEAAAQLRHEHIVAIYETGEVQGQPYFSMDFISGHNLADQVREGPLPARRAADYLVKIAEAIHYAHEQGILHRDLKPSNILIDHDDEPRVTDFGLAKRMQRDSFMTVTGQVVGSPSFMPPEQATASRGKVGRHSDVYGLGGILYYLLTARAPFQADSLEGVVTQVLNAEPVSPRLLNPAVPRDLETICLKCLEKDSGQRYATAAQLASDLRRYLNDEPIEARPVSRAEWVWRWCRRKPAFAGALAVASVALLILAIGSPLVALHFKRSRQFTALNLYGADIKGASVALEEDDLFGAKRLLERIALSPDQRDVRGWEWRYLMDQCRTDTPLGTHQREVESISFSSDDQVLASISADGVATLWDWRARKERLSWQAHKSVVRHRQMLPTHAVLFLPHTNILVTTGADELLHFWNPGLTDPLATFPTPRNESGLLACTRDGHLLATVRTNRVLLWDISDIRQARQVASLPTELRYVASILFLPDGKGLLVSSGPEAIQWWDISCVDQQPKPPRIVSGSLGMALSQDGRELVSWSRLKSLIMRWDLALIDTKEPKPVPHSQNVTPDLFRYLPDNRSLVSCGRNGNIVIWDLEEEHSSVMLKGHSDFIRDMAFTSDGRVLASASSDRTVRLWDVADVWRRTTDKQPALRHSSEVAALAFSPDPSSKYLASISWEDAQKERSEGLPAATLKLWNTASRTEVASLSIRHRVGSPQLLFSPDGQTIVFEDEHKIHLHAVPSLQAVTNWTGAKPAFSPGNSAIVYVSDNRVLRRDLGTGQVMTIGKSVDGVSNLAISPDARTVVTTGPGGVLTFWDALGHTAPARLDQGGHADEVEGLAFSPDGKTLATASWDTKLGLWDVQRRRNLDLISGHQDLLSQVAFAVDGRTLATSSQDNTVRLWSLTTRREIAVLRHPGKPWPLAFSPDGQWLATGCGDTIRFWHAPTFEEIDAAQKANKEGR